MDNIKISELSVTKQNLQRIADDIKVKLEIAEKMACTEETKQAVKKYRADLKKEFEELETERKEKTREYEKPLEEFKSVYSRLISEPFKAADQVLKNKIDEVETAQKGAKREAVESYATELIQSYALDWLESSRIMPNVTLSVSEKSLKKEVKDKVEKIKSEVDCINAISDNSELMAEYMKCLSLAQAKMTVVERQHTIEAAEKATAVYTQQEQIKQEVVERIEQLAPPVEVEEVKTYTMTFTVNGTIEQLKALKAFMLENNITFANGGTEK
jgi:hypothetical protein